MVLFLLPGATPGADGPINIRIYGTFASLLVLAVGVISFLGYRVEGEIMVEGSQLVLRATHSYAYSVQLNPISRWKLKRVWTKGKDIRIDSGWDLLKISFQDKEEARLFISECGKNVSIQGRMN